MAHQDHIVLANRRPDHDGVPRCALCTDDDAFSGQDWCPAANALVCDGCCTGLLHGEPERYFSLVTLVGSMLPPEAIAHACSRCSRAHAHIHADSTESDAGHAC